MGTKFPGKSKKIVWLRAVLAYADLFREYLRENEF